MGFIGLYRVICSWRFCTTLREEQWMSSGIMCRMAGTHRTIQFNDEDFRGMHNGNRIWILINKLTFKQNLHRRVV